MKKVTFSKKVIIRSFLIILFSTLLSYYLHLKYGFLYNDSFFIIGIILLIIGVLNFMTPPLEGNAYNFHLRLNGDNDETLYKQVNDINKLGAVKSHSSFDLLNKLTINNVVFIASAFLMFFISMILK